MFEKEIDKDLEQYGGEILRSPLFARAMGQTHHLRASLGQHLLRVTRAGLFLSYALEKVGISSDREKIVIGGLCHDLGMVGRHEKYRNNRECSAKHPLDSVKVAEEFRPEIDEKTKRIIERHMFPLNRKAPDSVEGVIVVLADKYASVKDLVAGRRPGPAKNSGRKR